MAEFGCWRWAIGSDLVCGYIGTVGSLEELMNGKSGCMGLGWRV